MNYKGYFVDPPSGWKYGFPKKVNEDITDINLWLIKNGYPKKEIDSLDNIFYVRYWIDNPVKDFIKEFNINSVNTKKLILNQFHYATTQVIKLLEATIYCSGLCNCYYTELNINSSDISLFFKLFNQHFKQEALSYYNGEDNILWWKNRDIKNRIDFSKYLLTFCEE